MRLNADVRPSASTGGDDIQFEDLHLTAEELERYGPALLVDHKGRDGQRVLVWTQ